MADMRPAEAIWYERPRKSWPMKEVNPMARRTRQARREGRTGQSGRPIARGRTELTRELVWNHMATVKAGSDLYHHPTQ